MSFLIFSILLITFINISHALIPTVCIHNATNNGICCPTSRINGMVCGGPKRGHCISIKFPHEKIPEIFMYDDRSEWPKRFFHKLCGCKERFFGVNCDQCYFGWTGKNCDNKVKYLRKNILKLSLKEKQILKYVIDRSLYVKSDYSIYIDKNKALQDPIIKPIHWKPATIQYVMVFLHRFGSRPTLFEDYLDCQNFGFLNYNHDGVIFATWHRYYMLFWEHELRRIAIHEFGAHDFALPYWDWTDLKECDICTNEYVGAPGIEDKYGLRIHRGSPYYNWTEFCVEPNDAEENPCYGCHATGTFGRLTRAWNSNQFPTKADVEFVLSIKDFFTHHVSPQGECNAFHRALEGSCGAPGADDSMFFTHNKVHTMIDGSMCCIGSAPNDPIFIYHHTQVDRMFEKYLRRYNPSINEYPTSGVRPGHSRDSYMIAFIPLVTNAEFFTKTHHLGYEYDNYEFGKGSSDLGRNYNELDSEMNHIIEDEIY